MIGFAAFIAVLLTIDGPGITVDEPLDVRPGRDYFQIAADTGGRFFSPAVVQRTYLNNKEHPPLGRWLLGAASRAFEPFEVQLRGVDPVGLYVRSARVAPAVCFGVLVWLAAATAGRMAGNAAAIGAGLALVAMPRVFGHAHLAALDTFVALFWTASLIAVDRALSSPRPMRGMLAAGVVWGLALLIKIHAWLLPPVVLVYCFVRSGFLRGAASFVCWMVVGLAVYFLGWPWLWYDTVGRLGAYLGTVSRAPTLVQYFGSVYQDVIVPWHYPWFYFFVTVPIGLHFAGAIGVYVWIKTCQRVPFIGLALASILLWLLVFSTRVPVYDGERLFLPVFALWSIVVGCGCAKMWQVCAGKLGRRAAVIGVFALQFIGVVQLAPFWLSYYNAAVGGLPGADRLGLELTYWGDTIDGTLLNSLVASAERDDTCALSPSLAPGQGLVSTTRAMLERGLILRDQEAVGNAKWLVAYRRSAYWPPAVRAIVSGKAVATRSRQGVWLSGVWRVPATPQAR